MILSSLESVARKTLSGMGSEGGFSKHLPAPLHTLGATMIYISILGPPGTRKTILAEHIALLIHREEMAAKVKIVEEDYRPSLKDRGLEEQAGITHLIRVMNI